MLSFITHSMRTRTYDEFLASFSNPGDEPNVLERHDRRAHFVMHMSVSCWYSASVSFPRKDGVGRIGSVSLQGGGDDFGVFITAAPGDDDNPSVKLRLALDQKAGRDAKAMVRALQAMPNWRRAAQTRELALEY